MSLYFANICSHHIVCATHTILHLHFWKTTIPRKNMITESEGELHSSPSHLPQRSAELKTSRNTSAARQPVIAIRNRELYDDGADYSDYFEVKRMPG